KGSSRRTQSPYGGPRKEEDGASRGAHSVPLWLSVPVSGPPCGTSTLAAVPHGPHQTDARKIAVEETCTMKITAVETYWTRIPFDMGGKPATMGGLNWQTMNTVWLRVINDQGLGGWGESV